MASGKEPLVLKIAYQSAERSQAASQSIGLLLTDGAIGTKTSARIPAMVVEIGDTFV